MRAPDGSTGNVDGQLLRVWLRRKYIDGAWAASSVSQQNGGGSQNHNLQPTRAQIPPKKKATPAQASVPDLLGGGWDSAPVPAAPAPVVNDAAWDAFGQSRSSTASFKPDFGSQPEANQQPVSQANFGQMPSQAPPPAPVPVPVPASSFQSSNQQSPDPPQQQTQQYSFNPNFPQPSTPNRSAPPAPAYGASFPGRQLPSLPAQQMNGSPYQDKFQQQSSAQNQVPVSQQAQQQQTTVQSQQGFNANFQQGQQQPVDHVQQNQHGFNASFQQQPAAQLQQNQQGFNANFQQGQQQPVDHVQQNQQGFNANFQQGQQQPVDHVRQNQQGLFNANFQNPAAQLPQNQASMQVVSHDEGQLQQNQQNLQTHVQSPEPQKQVVLDEKAAANQSQPAMPIEVSGSTDNVNSGPADSNSMHSSSAIDARVSADPFDAFNDLGIGSSSAPSSQRNDPPSPPDPSPTPPNMTANSTAKYQVGQKLEYRDSENNISLVEVLKAHLDDSLVPFYDIKMENGREKQTDDGHLSHQSASLVSKNALLGIVTTLLSNLDEHQLRAVENFVKDMKGIQS